MQNKDELPGMSRKQNAQAACSRNAIAIIGCTLNDLKFAWLLFGAHRMLRTPNFFSANTIVKTTQQSTAIDAKRIVTVLPL